VSEASIRQHPARERWNRRFSEPGAAPQQDVPSQWLVDNEALLRALAGAGGTGRALDVASGNGRNALYLVSLGFAVDALDISDVAIDALATVARERDLPVHARVADLEDEGIPSGPYDVVVVMNYLQRDLFGALAEAVAPGGLLLFENFARAHLDDLGAQTNPEFVLAPNELLRAFGGLLVRRYEEGVVERSGRPKGVASLVAQRPGRARAL
jgi:tellurite methyltransferase